MDWAIQSYLSQSSLLERDQMRIRALAFMTSLFPSGSGAEVILKGIQAG